MRDSINTVSGLIDYAIELNHEVIAITDHESVSNAIKVEKYYNSIKKEHPNFKVILGNEIYLTRDGLNAENFDKAKDKYAKQIVKFFEDVAVEAKAARA